ncbi:hypothetical protein [Mesobacillus jeotgali]|uniref:hypothetical protein n=1 Tax=Mesobacillus jeotgali TaxID=129985 RepID=UPI000C827E28|nr:hypothetical protein [Mesobacillus jeotgali]
MTLFRILTEVTGGMGIGIILLLTFILIFVGSAFYMLKKYKGLASPMKLSIGIAIYLVISAVLSDVLLNSLLFSQGEYINYGLGAGLFRLLFSILVGLLVGFLITKVVYFKVVSKSLLS